MRPSFTTLAGMSLAAGSIALATVGLVGTGSAAAQDDGLFHEPKSAIEVLHIAVDAESAFAQQPDEVGVADDRDLVELFDEGVETPEWMEDGCPPCGMG